MPASLDHQERMLRHMERDPLYQSALNVGRLLATLKIALPYVERAAKTRSTQWAGQQRQKQAARDAEQIRRTIAEIEDR